MDHGNVGRMDSPAATRPQPKAPPAASKQSRGDLYVIGLLLVVVVLVLGWALRSAASGDNDAKPAPVAASSAQPAAKVTADQLKVGECIAEIDTASLEHQVVSCQATSPKISSILDVDQAGYPAPDDPVNKDLASQCLAAVPDAMLPPDGYRYGFLLPERATWTSGWHHAACFVQAS